MSTTGAGTSQVPPDVEQSTSPGTTVVSMGTGPTETAGPDARNDRRADVDSKMALVAALLQECGCDGLLILEQDNLAWLTSGAIARGILDPRELPAVYCNGDARWLLSSNVDSQRMFDEEIDALGFQLKEWPYHWGREQLLADLCQNRKVACDVPHGECIVVGEQVRRLRRKLTVYEQACLQAVGTIVTHAVEATCRTMEPGLSEREMAAQVSHRMMHRGAQVLHVGIGVDGRPRRYRQHGYTGAILSRHAVVSATGEKYGVCATATRAVAFGETDPDFRKDHNAVCKVAATYLASTWPEAVPREILLAGRRIYLLAGYEHEWMLAPQGFVTGRAAVELPLLPQTEELFQASWVVTWTPSAGAARGGDTYLITDQGPKLMTPTEVWPLKRIRVQGAEFVHPDILQR
jgi:Xaa-Pro aminopeptidase